LEQKTARYAGEIKCLSKEQHLSDIMMSVQAIKTNRRKVLLSMAESLAHTKWMCKYHIVFTPKYRRKIIYNQLRVDIQQIIKDLCKWKGIEILEGHMMPDHVHLLLSIPPKYSVSQIMGYLKGKSAMMIFDRHSNLKYKFGNRNFWAEGYYVSTVGLNEATIAKYIREQDKHDQIMDKITTKELEDPFRGLAK
jgi:putative transposase